MRAAPGGPFDLERPLDPAVMENLRRIYRLDEPLWRQYLDLLSRARARRSRTELLLARFHGQRTVRQGAADLGRARRDGACARASSSASRRALSQRRARTARADAAVTAAASLGVTLPNFVVAPLLQLVFGLWLKMLPVGGYGDGAARNLDPARARSRRAAGRRGRAPHSRGDDRGARLARVAHACAPTACRAESCSRMRFARR